jgi:hypothetical protein
MDQLFIALPRDLQWEVLTTFAGTHVVRKGKLMRKIVMNSGKFQIVHDMPHITKCIGEEFFNIKYSAKAMVDLGDRRKLMLCECPNTNQLGYKYRVDSLTDGIYLEYVQLKTNPHSLPAFVKHSYPSYEDSDKKKERRKHQKL